MYSVAKTERQNLTHVAGTGTYRRHSQSIKEVVPIAEYQLEQEILQPAVLDSPGHSSADNDTDAPVPLSADGRFDSAVAVKYVRKTKRTTYITTAFHPKPLPLEIALAVMVNREPNCQCIIKLLDWQDDPDHYLIVMERLVPSMDMRTFLKCSGGILREQTAQYIMWQIIYAANFCCNRGIFHRDIKLANLIVNPTTLEIKLIDFGCGDLMKDSGYSTYSGTKPYFPPEYHDRGRYHAKPATVFSLGVLLFGMLHGRFPTAKDLHCLGNNRSVFAVSKECILFLWACLQRHPERRILLEQMLYDDWFVLGFPNGLPYNRNASNQHSHHR
ncbi:hypothetical protein cypCar_00008449 [Cyprinus carpio]|nr:hypothetical protein cypCar_00008449 [Cyprinus carpio]